MNWFEKFLGMDRFTKSGDIVRMRATYIIVLAFIIVQLINIGQLQFSYEYWTRDANIAVAAIGLMSLVLISYRYHSRFILAALAVMVLTVGGIGFSALENNTGINSALLPFLPVAIVIGGFISGWRMALGAGIVSIIFTIGLFLVSQTASGSNLYDPAMFGTQNFQRVSQVTLACVMVTLITASYSHAMHGLFQRNEDSLEKVRQAEKDRTEFFSALSHEIRTPLNGIVGMSGLLVRSELTSQQHQYAKIVNECSENLLDVMSNVMEISQLDNERIDLKPTIFDIYSLADDLAKELQPSIKENPEITFGMHITPAVPKYLHADHKRLRLIINHLLRNAVKFTKKGSVSLLIDGNKVQDNIFRLCVYVRDTGVGIEKANLDRIYDRFHQLDNSLSRKYEGSGLGLSICKEIVEFMGGNLNAVSEPGIGSTFYFDLTVPIALLDSDPVRTEIPQGNDGSAVKPANIVHFKKPSSG